MAVGVVLGKLLPGATNALRQLESGDGSQINFLPLIGAVGEKRNLVV